MQFIFNEDSNLYGYADGDREFEFPSNIKQMGCIDDRVKIYVEDYVYTYLYQYAKSGGGRERLGALAGRHMVVDEQDVIIISGAIQAKATLQDKGVETFTEETWEYINNQMEVYFKGLSLVGWVHTQPGFGAFLMARDEEFHKKHFSKSWQVLFVIDTLDKLDTFFVNNQEKTGLQSAKGYFIYYEKNKEMQEYMLNNSLVRAKTTEEEGEITEGVQAGEASSVKERKKPLPEERIDAAKDIRRVLKKRAKEAEEESKTKFTMLAGVSSILCLACLLMGISLLNNMDRLRKLETEIQTVQNSYVTMAQKLDERKTETVFAAQGEDKEESSPKEEVPVPVETKKAETVDYYVVEDGDNLGYISTKYYGTKDMIHKIMEANGLDNADKIWSGQKLVIPK